MRFLRSKLKKGDDNNVIVSFYSEPNIELATLIVSDFQEPGTLMFLRRAGRREFLTEFLPEKDEGSLFESTLSVGTEEILSLLACPDAEELLGVC